MYMDYKPKMKKETRRTHVKKDKNKNKTHNVYRPFSKLQCSLLQVYNI